MKVFLFLIVIVLGHVHHGNHSHGHHHHGHNHNHDHSHNHHSHDSHKHSSHNDASKAKIEVLSETQREVVSPPVNLFPDTFYGKINKQISDSGPFIATSISSVLTSSASLLIFGFIWVIKKNDMLTTNSLNTLMSFSSGALLGDVFLHLLPSTPSTQFSSMLILSGILGFFVLDRTLSHSHSHADTHSSGKNEDKKEKKHAHNEDQHSESAILLFFADFLHNVTDGMAIGASYSIGSTLGITTTIAIFLHEIAHEIGDFIAFLKFGMSLENSLYMNLITAVGSLIGGSIVVFYGTSETLATYVLPIVVGNFLYVSLVSMLASMRNNDKKNIIWEIIFFGIGVGLMVLIEELE